MSAPIPDAPTPDAQSLITLRAGFAPSPPVFELCGFKPPLFAFAFGFNLPPLGIPYPLPIPRFALGITCSLTNPIDVSVGIPYGGKRVGTVPRDPDDDFR